MAKSLRSCADHGKGEPNGVAKHIVLEANVIALLIAALCVLPLLGGSSGHLDCLKQPNRTLGTALRGQQVAKNATAENEAMVLKRQSDLEASMRIKQAEHKAAALREQAEPAKQRALKIQHVEDPTVALYIRAYSGDTTNLLWCLWSYQIFWAVPKTDLVVVLDAESTNDAQFGKLLAMAGINVKYEEPPAAELKVPGYERQQLSRLVADQHTRADIICSVDADTVFQTKVTMDSLMADGKLSLRGEPLSGKSRSKKYSDAAWALLGNSPSEGIDTTVGEKWVNFMANYPQCHYRMLYPKVRETILSNPRAEGISDFFSAVVKILNSTETRRGLSDFNVLGYGAWHLMRPSYSFCTGFSPDDEYNKKHCTLANSFHSHFHITKARMGQDEKLLGRMYSGLSRPSQNALFFRKSHDWKRICPTCKDIRPLERFLAYKQLAVEFTANKSSYKVPQGRAPVNSLE